MQIADEPDSQGKLHGRCDSFVVETNVEYPTDTRLLFDAIRKAIELLILVCTGCGLLDWEDGKCEVKKFKKLLRNIQRLKHSKSKDEAKKEARKKEIIEAHQKYLDVGNELLQGVKITLQKMRQKYPEMKYRLLKIEEFLDHAERQITQIERRVIQGETIPHKEKVFSIFEPHTEWISKGKAGVPVELGLKVCIMEDQYHFILNHKVMQQQTDEQITISFVKETQDRFPGLDSCSFDQGFHSLENQRALADLLELPVLPKKGKRSKIEQAREQADEFVQARRQHAAVESAINALEVHGLDRCPDRGLPAFKRYVALAVVARNIQVLGVSLRRQEHRITRPRYREAA